MGQIIYMLSLLTNFVVVHEVLSYGLLTLAAQGKTAKEDIGLE